MSSRGDEKKKLMEAVQRLNWGSTKAYLLPLKPRIFKIPIDKYVKTLPTGYNTTESHTTVLTYRHPIQTAKPKQQEYKKINTRK